MSGIHRVYEAVAVGAVTGRSVPPWPMSHPLTPESAEAAYRAECLQDVFFCFLMLVRSMLE
jgi:hypothetical protein